MALIIDMHDLFGIDAHHEVVQNECLDGALLSGTWIPACSASEGVSSGLKELRSESVGLLVEA